MEASPRSSCGARATAARHGACSPATTTIAARWSTTVDDAGLYGFRIVVESAGGAPAIPPRSGDAPELWVDVDLHQPTAELTSIELGTGNLADHLILRWRAEDDNLDPRPIALFYSSRPAGPWTAIATNLENTGEYAWQVQRHVPDRFYLRLEARDVAGNLAAFQTREASRPAGYSTIARLRGAESLGPTAGQEASDFANLPHAA